jgi:hypothetical protein
MRPLIPTNLFDLGKIPRIYQFAALMLLSVWTLLLDNLPEFFHTAKIAHMADAPSSDANFHYSSSSSRISDISNVLLAQGAHRPPDGILDLARIPDIHQPHL